jgi:hypothetical protein
LTKLAPILELEVVSEPIEGGVAAGIVERHRQTTCCNAGRCRGASIARERPPMIQADRTG